MLNCRFLIADYDTSLIDNVKKSSIHATCDTLMDIFMVKYQFWEGMLIKGARKSVSLLAFSFVLLTHWFGGMKGDKASSSCGNEMANGGSYAQLC